MKKLLVLSLVLLMGVTGFAKTNYFDDIWVGGDVTVEGTVTFTDLDVVGNFTADGAVHSIDGSTSIALITAALNITGDSFTTGDTTQTGSFTATGTITADTFTDGTVSLSSGTFSGISDLGSVTTCDINGGTITGITDLAVADGGTGSSNASDARTALGLAIGTNVQAWDAQLDDIAALVQSDSYIIVGDDTNWVQETGATARTSLGVAIGTDVQAYDADLAALAGLTSAANTIPYFTGAATAGTVTSSANMISWLASADYATARTNLGVEIGADVQAWDAQLDDIAALVQSDSYIIVGDDTNWIAETGATARTSLGLAIATDVEAHTAALTEISTAQETATNEGVVFVSVYNIVYTQTASITIFTLPANADIIDVVVIVQTDFDGSGSDLLNVGTAGTSDLYVDDLDISSAVVKRMGDATMPYAGVGDVGGTAVAIKAIYADANGDASTGAATIYVYWTMGTAGSL